MRTYTKLALLLSALSFSGLALSWGNSFSVGDSWNSNKSGGSWSTPNWGWSADNNANRWNGPGYYPPQGYYYPPYMSPYDRNKMKMDRQQLMSDHDDAMDSLSDMLYGRFRFDRNNAINMARRIEHASGDNLSRYFQTGSIAASGSNTAPSYWGNEETFKTNADALKVAAQAMADELTKKPTGEEAALYPRMHKGFDYRARPGVNADPISPQIFDRFNELAAACTTCHAGFRMRD